MSSASTSKITTTLEDGSEKQFFMKTGSGKEAEIMFEGSLPSPPCTLRVNPNMSQANTHL